jgi:hypothetical protein
MRLFRSVVAHKSMHHDRNNITEEPGITDTSKVTENIKIID